MRINWKSLRVEYFKTDKFITTPLIISLVIFLFLHAIFFITFRSLPTKIPLFYSLPWGQSQLVSRNQFLLLPAVLLFVTLINSTFAWRLHSSQVLLRRMLFVTVIVADLILLIAGLKIITIFL